MVCSSFRGEDGGVSVPFYFDGYREVSIGSGGPLPQVGYRLDPAVQQAVLDLLLAQPGHPGVIPGPALPRRAFRKRGHNDEETEKVACPWRVAWQSGFWPGHSWPRTFAQTVGEGYDPSQIWEMQVTLNDVADPDRSRAVVSPPVTRRWRKPCPS